jgi:hypothetical protein
VTAKLTKYSWNGGDASVQCNAEPVAIGAEATLEWLVDTFDGGEDTETVGQRSLGGGMRGSEGGVFSANMRSASRAASGAPAASAL